MRKRVALKVTTTRFSCGCFVPGYRPARWKTFVRGLKRLREFRFLETHGKNPDER